MLQPCNEPFDFRGQAAKESFGNNLHCLHLATPTRPLQGDPLCFSVILAFFIAFLWLLDPSWGSSSGVTCGPPWPLASWPSREASTGRRSTSRWTSWMPWWARSSLCLGSACFFLDTQTHTHTYHILSFIHSFLPSCIHAFLDVYFDNRPWYAVTGESWVWILWILRARAV